METKIKDWIASPILTRPAWSLFGGRFEVDSIVLLQSWRRWLKEYRLALGSAP